MDLKLFITTLITITVIVDPVRRRRFANQAVIAATAVIFIFAFFGHYVLDYLGISIESLMVAGGVLLGIVALDMMKGRVNAGEVTGGANPALVPLGTPLLAGPGAVVAAMLLIDEATGTADKALVAAGILASLLLVWLALTMATGLVRLLRDTGVDLLTRVMGILLAAIAVEFIHQAVVSW